MTGFGDTKNSLIKQFERLNKKLIKRLWLLKKREKDIFKSRYGIGCSPQSARTIAEKWGLTDARIRGIIIDGKKKMSEAYTYSPELREDLDNLGYVLSDKERYTIYHRRSIFDISYARDKIKSIGKIC